MRRILAVALIVFSTLAATPAAALAPPEFIFWAKLKATVGTDPCVSVGDVTLLPDNTYAITVGVCDRTQAEALNVVLGRAKAPKDVSIIVTGADGSALPTTPACAARSVTDVATLYRTALAGSSAVMDVSPSDDGSTVWVDVAPDVVQFFADNIGDRHGNATIVARDAFDEVLNLRACGQRPSVYMSVTPLDQ
jgi:hypothetical protein